MEWTSEWWDAWCDHPPGVEPPLLRVVGRIDGSSGLDFLLSRAELQSAEERDLALELVVTAASVAEDEASRYTLAYDESGCGFDRVTIIHEGETIAEVPVRRDLT